MIEDIEITNRLQDIISGEIKRSRSLSGSQIERELSMLIDNSDDNDSLFKQRFLNAIGRKTKTKTLRHRVNDRILYNEIDQFKKKRASDLLGQAVAKIFEAFYTGKRWD